MAVTVQVGAAVRDVTPPVGLAMSGFVARTSPATGTHDPMTVRALVVGETALVTVDVVGLHEDFCAEVRSRCPLPEEGVVVHATHTHGGPGSMPGRLGGIVDHSWLEMLTEECVAALAAAMRDRRPATVHAGYGNDPGVARNRRRPEGPVDSAIPLVRMEGLDGRTIAVLVSYACHPVVLGADNTLWTADYPGVVRTELEAQFPGCIALFATGCAGDANTGHAPGASLSTEPTSTRTFDEAGSVGRRIALATARCDSPAPGPVMSARAVVPLGLEAPGQEELLVSAAAWRAGAASAQAEPATSTLLSCWADWADRHAAARGTTAQPWPAPVTVLRWGGALLVTLPGEPFAESARAVRQAVGSLHGVAVTLVIGYTDGCPGYLPPAVEYPLGGYEVTEAHRYYGMPGPFARYSAERLVACAQDLALSVCRP